MSRAYRWLRSVKRRTLASDTDALQLPLATSLFFSSRRRHTRFDCDWSSDVCSSDLVWSSKPMAQMNRNREKVDASQLDIKDTVVSINRVTKVVKGGKNLSFSALVVEIGRASCRERV